MTTLLIVDETITDPELFEDYKRAVVPTITKYGGRFVARGAAYELLETGTDWSPGRLVVIAFPSMAALKDWYHSDDYAPARDIRFRAASSTLVALDTGGSEATI